MKRREFITLLGSAAAWPLAARAQQAGMPVIGFLSSSTAATEQRRMAAFRQGLAGSGFIEGRNVSFEFRGAEGQSDLLPVLAAELVRRGVAVIIAPNSSAAAVAAKSATSTTPIVFSMGDDPMRHGLVASFTKPGGNVTGVNYFSAALGQKRIGLLRELVPQSSRFGVLVNPKNPTGDTFLADAREAATSMGLQVNALNASNTRELDEVLGVLAEGRPDALLVSPDPLFTTRRTQIFLVSARVSVPAIYSNRELVEAGGLMSYGTSSIEVYRLLGFYAGRILKGDKPSDLPVIQSTRFELVLNLQAAKAISLQFPSTLLAQADEVIE